ncbi:MAG: cytochrome c [Acidobacteria bacterium]|nr:cytochrome c [Acidobacteriota bacterium]
MIEKYVDSKELKQLLSTLVAIVGCLIIAALFGIIVVPGLRNANKPAKPTAVAPVVGESGWLDPTEFPAQKGRVIPPVDPMTLIKPSDELADIGEKLYETNCRTCHGSLGRGDGPASNVDPQPRDFTAAEGWTNGPDMPNVYKTLSEGIPGTSMASYDYLTKRERMALVHYVQFLGGYGDSAGSAEAMQALAGELAAPGETTNNKIPVSMAMEKLEGEFVFPLPLMIPIDDRSPGADILRRTVTDASRAAQVLHASEIWRAGPDALARSILPDIPSNGFSTKLATLKPSEWQTLYDALLRRIRPN